MSHLKDIKLGYKAIGSLLKESGEFRKDFAMGIIDTPVVVTKTIITLIDNKLGCTQRRYNVTNAVNDRLLSEYGDELSDMNRDVRHMLKNIMSNKVTKTYNQSEQETTEYTEFSVA
jgi:hypothetical protein|tara:strand:- start:11 stop:358 length:348 start_codon:yes stop_codon:yes gene_type:complete